MNNPCLTCSAIGCGGLKYNPYTQSWCCQVFNVEEVRCDNKTTIVVPTELNKRYGMKESEE